MLIVDSLLRFKFIKEIGLEGRNSKVHIVHDPQLDANLVIKVIEKSDITQVDDYFNEAQMLYATQHPNIMSIRYASQDDSKIYLAMDHYKNGSLNTLMNTDNLSVRNVIKYTLEFLSGLHFMHTRNLVHLDIKPTNILINDTGRAVLTDFGLSKYLNEHGFVAAGKQYNLHAPPEVYRVGKLSFYADIYQAGLTMYRMCNGDKFFKEQLSRLNISSPEMLAESIFQGKFPDKNAFLPHIPVKLQKVIKKSLELNLEDRYETVMDLMNDLSLIDVNLDWTYNEITETHSIWSVVKNGFTHKLLLTKSSNTEWVTEGYKVKNEDNSQTRLLKWNTNGYTNRNKAFAAIKKLLSE